ncbi:CPBP family intramembrane glutamic endopeptidase [Microbacterium sp. SS28]|uniref:CPBP family intramembrane glutamic endopeptidase n=1 Tax=Microbacterium sp. SS28 TaxID=2919948 RepID=UPI001FA98922|nr:CPBP family glutamic-type intramembrane protease [Microbacterium sp. SS28]
MLLVWATFGGPAVLPEPLPTVVAVVATSLPLVVAVFAAGARAGRGGTARATGIRHWRWLDLLIGLAAGLAVRSLIEFASPTTGSLGGPLGAPGFATVAVVAVTVVVVSPLVEELFFRGLVLRALAQRLADAGAAVAAVVSILVSTGAFVLLHLVTLQGAVPVSVVLSGALVGVVCGILTLATGRLGAALAAHAVSNLVGVVLLLV